MPEQKIVSELIKKSFGQNFALENWWIKDELNRIIIGAVQDPRDGSKLAIAKGHETEAAFYSLLFERHAELTKGKAKKPNIDFYNPSMRKDGYADDEN